MYETFQRIIGNPRESGLKVSFWEQCPKLYCRTDLGRKCPLTLQLAIERCYGTDYWGNCHHPFTGCQKVFLTVTLVDTKDLILPQFFLIFMKARPLSHYLHQQNRFQNTACFFFFSFLTFSLKWADRDTQFRQHLDSLAFLVKIQFTLYENASIIIILC